MAQNDVYGLKHQFRDHGSVWSVSHYYRDATGVDEALAAPDLNLAAYTKFNAQFDLCRAEDSTYEGSYCWKVIKDTGMPDCLDAGSSPGNNALTTSLPPNNCAVFTFRTNAPEAVRFGRFYWAGIPKEWLLAGIWNATAMGAFQTLAGLLDDTLTGSLGSYVPVILRKVSGGLPLSPWEYSDVSNVSVTSVVYGQRRRTSRQFGFAN